MYVVGVEFEIVPSQLENFIGAMRKNAAQSFADEAGCQQFDICQDQKNPNSLFLYEAYWHLIFQFFIIMCFKKFINTLYK